ncbi:MAG: mitochondrial peripheral inner membrane protein [Thelocarpon impressellum]|nr:MAG: mitochondrial peripheral inner membrane protein [Thelocarpon impressellum]
MISPRSHSRLLAAPRRLPLCARHVRSHTTLPGSPRRRWPLYVSLAALPVGYYVLSGPKKQTLDPTTFAPYALVARTPVSSTSSIFTLRPLHSPPAYSWDGVWSVQFKQPQLQIARSYTPLPPSLLLSPAAEDGDLRFLIRREHRGEVSSYLHRLPPGSTVEVRGPKSELAIPGDVDEVLFLAGGTGIAPALQTAYCLLRRGGGTRVRVLWANRRREDCVGGENTAPGTRGWWPFSQQPPTETAASPHPLVAELTAYRSRYPDRFGITYLVDAEGTGMTPSLLRAHLRTSDDREVRARKKTLVLLSGPDAFIAHLAGSQALRAREAGRSEDGAVGGVLGHLIPLGRDRTRDEEVDVEVRAL